LRIFDFYQKVPKWSFWAFLAIFEIFENFRKIDFLTDIDFLTA